ncbi:MAG: HDOD domain-containing protein [Desulfobacteraceae bacterium]|nr:HDOD domain-containing protein [Desulfobacteraceae bacterium]
MEEKDQNQKRQEVRARLRYIKSLPILPPIASMLNKMVEDEEMTAVRLGAVIEKDQVLTSKLLKMVNSSFFGFPQRISTVSNAIVLLGFSVIKTLIVTSSIFDMMQSSDVGLWEHSLGCATVAGILARRRAIKNPEEVSTAGLIHDLGKVVIRAEFTKEYNEIQGMVETRRLSMMEAELECIGVAHPEIGGWLIKQWNLPDRLILPVLYHHNPEGSPEFRELSAIVHFSDILIRAIGFGSGGDLWVPPLDHQAWERIKMGKGEVKDLLNELDERIIELQDFTIQMQQTKVK